MTFWFGVFIIIIIVFFYHCWNVVEGFSNRFLTPSETKNLLLSNHDGYYNRFTADDWAARGLTDSYTELLTNAVYPECPVSSLNKVIEEADLLISRFNDLEDGWVYKDKLQRLPWIIAMSPDGYEFGLPHTRGYVIMLGSVVDADTLVHEKLHVYQKLYPKDFDVYLRNNGFSLSKLRVPSAANPDSDGQVYECDGVPWYSYYLKGSDEGFRSVHYKPFDDPRYDCPHEFAVYTLLENK